MPQHRDPGPIRRFFESQRPQGERHHPGERPLTRAPAGPPPGPTIGPQERNILAEMIPASVREMLTPGGRNAQEGPRAAVRDLVSGLGGVLGLDQPGGVLGALGPFPGVPRGPMFRNVKEFRGALRDMPTEDLARLANSSTETAALSQQHRAARLAKEQDWLGPHPPNLFDGMRGPMAGTAPGRLPMELEASTFRAGAVEEMYRRALAGDPGARGWANAHPWDESKASFIRGLRQREVDVLRENQATLEAIRQVRGY